MITQRQFFVLDERRRVVRADVLEWTAWVRAHGGARQIASTIVGTERVATTFLGWADNGGLPRLFESYVFGARCAGMRGNWDTWEGHRRMCERVLARLVEETPWDEREEESA